MSGVREFLEARKPAIITVGLITAVQGFVAMLVTDGPAAPAIMLVGLIAIALALVPGARSPET
jgi:heme O synthase-like polyprenyltransferase